MKVKPIVIPFAVAVLFFACTPKVELPHIHSGNADFTRFVAIGDGYMAGYQDGAMWQEAQSRSIPALLFSSLQQAGSTSFNQALMPDNSGLGTSSKPWEGIYVTASRLGYKTDCEGVSSLSPLKSFHSAGSEASYLSSQSVSSLDDFTVPFANVADLNSAALNTTNVYWNRVAGNFSGLSPAAAAASRQPSFFAAWLGMEDIFYYARNGGFNCTINSSSSFAAGLDSILLPMVNNGAKGILATLPDFRNFPYYSLVTWNGADLEQDDADSLTALYVSFGMPHISFQAGKNGFVIEDPAAPSGYRQMISDEYITLSVPIDSMKCYYYGILVNVIHDRYSLDSSEVTFLDQMISDYNAVIIQKAAQYGLAVADMNTYFANVKTGIMSNGVEIDAEFVSGGFYSLDGFYPTQKGAALIANQFILAINAYYGSTLPAIHCADCNGVIFP
ncbi:MAG: hypothetical protein ACOZCO_08290 [Bacteroidota bacterium]